MKPSRESGIIGPIILILIALIILGYFKINIQDLINNPVVQDNVHYAWNLIVREFEVLKESLIQFIAKLGV